MPFRKLFQSDDNSLETGGKLPAHLKAIAENSTTEGAENAAKLVRTVLFGGTLSPALKLAMGVRVSQQCQVPYATEYFQRLAASAGPIPDDRERTAIALRYADDLTRDIHGIPDDRFAAASARFNDAQLIELTMATCFFNYFARLVAGLGVKPDDWWKATRPKLPAPVKNPLESARVALASDAELSMAVTLEQRRTAPNSPTRAGLGLAIANSQRAMVRVPDIQQAWMGRFSSTGTVPRSTLLQVSLAVSTVNGCRYCVLHQVQGLRRQGVEIGKLVALQKDDSALSPTEKAAVDFARKLTKTPGAVTDADRAALRASFPANTWFEVLNQTATFAFMNRFTDGLRLPSEDEAVKTYQETYGRNFPERPYK